MCWVRKRRSRCHHHPQRLYCSGSFSLTLSFYTFSKLCKQSSDQKICSRRLSTKTRIFFWKMQDISYIRHSLWKFNHIFVIFFKLCSLFPFRSVLYFIFLSMFLSLSLYNVMENENIFSLRASTPELKSHLKWVYVIFADILPTALDISSGTSTNSINANYFPTNTWIGEIRDRSRYPYSFPYFLFPPKHKNPIVLASQRSEIISAHEVYAQTYDNGTLLMHKNHSMHKFPKHHNISVIGTTSTATANFSYSRALKDFRNFGKNYMFILL